MIDLILSFILSFAFLSLLIPYMQYKGIMGGDVNKPNKPYLPESCGIGVVLTVVVLLALYGQIVIASSILIIAIIGIIDDLYGMHQAIKAVAPMIAGIPLLLILQVTAINIPIIGMVDFGIFYFAIVFLSLAVASNLTNMLAGFNGIEYGMASAMFFGSFFIGFIFNIPIVTLISAIMLGACLAGFYFGFPVAKMFPGDVGTLTIGGTMAIMLLVGHIEAYAIVFIPYIIDFIIKAKNRFPSTGWEGTYRDGKLHCDKEPVGFAQQVMKWANGINEVKLVMWFIFFELFFVCMGYTLISFMVIK